MTAPPPSHPTSRPEGSSSEPTANTSADAAPSTSSSSVSATQERTQGSPAQRGAARTGATQTDPTRDSGNHSPDAPPDAPYEPTSWLRGPLTGGALAVGLVLALLGYGAAVATWVAKIVVPALILGWIWKAALQRRPSSASHWLRDRLTSHGTGFYGLVASATFAVKQSLTLIEDIPEGWTTMRAMLVPLPDVATLLDITSSQLWQAAVQGFIRFSAETILNGVWAMMWPLSWTMNLGYAYAGLLAVGLFGIYRATLHLSPEVRFLLGPSIDEARPSPDESGSSSSDAHSS